MSMSLFKIPFLLTGTYGFYVAVTPPVPPAKKEELLEDIPLSERLFRAMVHVNAMWSKYAMWGLSLCETAVVLAQAYPASPLAAQILRTLVWSPTSRATRIRLSRTFLISWPLVVAGSYVRWLCFRTLGRHFTFEVALKREHELVTSGPYGVVRHPSYSGGALVLVSILPLMIGPGSWFWECGARDGLVGKVLALVLASPRMYALYAIIRRTPVEDRMLEGEFGDKWRAWAEKVRWKWIPGIW